MFHPLNAPGDYKNTYGFKPNEELSEIFHEYDKFLEAHPGKRIPDVFKKTPHSGKCVDDKGAEPGYAFAFKRRFRGPLAGRDLPGTGPGLSAALAVTHALEDNEEPAACLPCLVPDCGPYRVNVERGGKFF